MPERIDELNEDSVLTILENAFSASNLKLVRGLGKNYCTDEIIATRSFRGNEIGQIHIENMSIEDIEGLQIIPIVFIDNLVRFTGSMSSSGVTDDSGFNFIPYVTLLVIIVDQGEVVYRSTFTHNATMIRGLELEEAMSFSSAASVTQQNWNELVKRTMHRYKKRLETSTSYGS
jgi:hypothetical protein